MWTRKDVVNQYIWTFTSSRRSVTSTKNNRDRFFLIKKLRDNIVTAKMPCDETLLIIIIAKSDKTTWDFIGLRAYVPMCLLMLCSG
jgi:hypothetical protein